MDERIVVSSLVAIATALAIGLPALGVRWYLIHVAQASGRTVWVYERVMAIVILVAALLVPVVWL